MTERILTLCEKCKSDIEIGGFRVKAINGKTTTEKKGECENCGQREGGTVKQYIVSARGK